MALQQGLSGLNATSKNLEIIGNNIANANTFGYKTSRAEFSDMYAAALNGAGGNTVGIGVNLAAVAQQFTQGNISVTANSMDLAINGPGFFQVTDGVNPTLYSRNGQFKVDRDGFVVNNEGLKLMGFPATGSGVIQPGQAVPLQLPTAGIDPAATSRIALEMNLDSRAAPVASPGTIDVDDPTTYNNATSVTIYDSKGQDIAMTYYFQKSGNDTWNVFVFANGTAVGSPIELTFDTATGRLTGPASPVALPVPVTTNAAGALTVPFAPPPTLDLRQATQFGAPFGVTDLTQDGYAPGQLSGITIEANGIVMARYSNGQTKPAGQLELATFRNPQGLQPQGGGVWARSFASGDPIVGVPGEGNMGVLQSGALEESNVDITAELVNMITAQRMYQANAQTIKTTDQAMQSLLNLR
ncbi:MAG: flagellar hook protein FlgE [Rubrivivax sp.]|nr:flagellar hook protein FlgE [Rubrivivax sp.]